MSSASARKSPRRTPARTEASPMSPVRVTRLEEKKELQDLNNRLALYIHNNRERDGFIANVQAERDALRQAYEDQIAHAEDLHNAQLSELRKARDAEAAARARLESENRALAAEATNAQREAASLKESFSRLKSQNEELARQNRDAQAQSTDLQDENEQLASENALLKEQLADANAELEQLRNENAQAVSAATNAESQLRAVQSDSDIARSKATAEIKRLQKQYDDLLDKHSHMQEELRQELSQQLATILAERQREYDEDKDNALEELKNAYDEKIKAYRDHLERAGHELEMLKAQKAAAVHEAEVAKSTSEKFETIKIEMQTRIRDLQEAVRTEQARPARLADEKMEIIRRLKAAFKRKDQEFDALMDVKVALALEIKRYRDMLEKEEQRLGTTPDNRSSKKKRKLDDGQLNVEEKEVMAVQDDQEDTLVFSGMDLHGLYLTIKNGSTIDINLGGWAINTQVHGHQFPLPGDITLKPGQALTIWTGADAMDKHNPPTDLAFLTEGPAWDDQSGDVADLVDPNGDVVASVEVVPENFSLLEEEVDADGDAEMEDAVKPEAMPVDDQDANKCSLM